MGQYYKPISIDAQQWLYSHEYDNGLKLMEHSWVGNEFVQAVVGLLRTGGKWHKTRVVWAGDYMDNGVFLENPAADENLYHFADDNFKKVKPAPNEDKSGFVINHTKKQFCKIPEFSEEAWTPHPLPLLTCSGNGRGGGDYRRDNKFVGKWAGDVISVENEPPKNFKEINPNFLED